MANGVACEKVGDRFAPKCRTGFKLTGSALCVSVCPADTTDAGDKCLKSQRINTGDVFVWAAGEEQTI